MSWELGNVMSVGHYRTACCLAAPEAEKLLLELTKLAGMNPLELHFKRFPVNGAGGIGYMIFVIFTESCAYCDCYENTRTTWWHISSCLSIPFGSIRDRLVSCGAIVGQMEYEL